MFVGKFLLIALLYRLVWRIETSSECMCREILMEEDSKGDSKEESEEETPLKIDLDTIKYASRRWPNKTIYVNSSLVMEPLQHFVYKAMDYLNSVTCINFLNTTVPKSGPEIYIARDMGCASLVGFSGKDQPLTMWDTCYLTNGIIIHEMLHAAGLYHHHSRADRDQYIFVNFSNIIDDLAHNYKKNKGYHGLLVTMGVPYDYHSVMHYGKNGFDKDPNYPSIVVLGDRDVEIGQRLFATRTDIATINRYYECRDHYLGDDIPGSVPYDEWFRKYMGLFKAAKFKYLTDEDKIE
ncbi:low choriolytic enzyme-like [Procambarus clarkii]|uniref:low choriolytic enzyme-like n=1 Tax=Procambarus clarkii TaxID=6728 RepID=UPI001E6761DD|nr:low choriolytic enzyme-like [Procambarus clarkii]